VIAAGIVPPGLEGSELDLADLLAHYAFGGTTNPNELIKMARSVGMHSAQLRSVVYDLPLRRAGDPLRPVAPSPLSGEGWG